MIKRREFITKTALGVAGALISAPAIAQSQPQIKWRITSSYPKSLDILWNGVANFSTAVAEATDNKFQIQAFAANEIVPGLQALDAVTNGTVEMCQTASYYYIGKDPTFALPCSIPFGLNSRMQNSWMYSHGGTDLFNAFLAKFNVIAFPAGNTGCQMGGWFRKELTDVSDLKGLKFRVGGFAGRVLQKLGVIPQQIAAGDIYPALEKGSIDAAEWVGPHDDEKLGFYKVAKYYYYPGWWEGGSVIHHMVNLDKWKALPDGYKSALRTASTAANLAVGSAYDDANPVALRRLLASGTQLRPFPAKIMDASLVAAKEVYAETVATNLEFKKIYENIASFRDDQYLWWQIAEYSYDTFMVRNCTQLG